MVQDTKLTLTEEELEAILNCRFFVVKKEVTAKVSRLFGELERELVKKISTQSVFQNTGLEIMDSGKLFRGENYKLMPYLMMDCPRVFHADTIFAFRSMFRWGHEFSFTLHLQGRALEMLREKIIQKISMLFKQDFFICVNSNPWEFDFDKSNYHLLDSEDQADLTERIRRMEFVKLSRKIDLENYHRLVLFGIETFDMLMEILQ